jgi:glycosyltransferase involved in cell wall biosynthesis
MRLVHQLRFSPQRRRPLDERPRLSFAAAPEARILPQYRKIDHEHRRGIAGKAIGQYATVIALSLLTLAPGRMGGSEGYARGLTSALARTGSLDYLAVVPPDAQDAGGGLPVRVAGASSASRRASAFAGAAAARRALAGAQVVHYPLTVPLPTPGRPHVVTLHDVLHLDHPELVPRAVRAGRRVLYDRAARHADRVIVPSEFVRERAVARLGLDRETLRVVQHGVDHRLFRPGDDDREPFLLYPARGWPHKNHRLLFAALAIVRRSRPGLELHLTGGSRHHHPLPQGARSLGILPAEELAGLYRRASVLVFPSLYEGFGWPVLEAMASGCTVAAARGHSVEELLDGAGVLIDPSSQSSIAAGILAALENAAELGARGLERAAQFTWERCAREHDEVYRELSSERRRRVAGGAG